MRKSKGYYAREIKNTAFRNWQKAREIMRGHLWEVDADKREEIMQDLKRSKTYVAREWV